MELNQKHLYFMKKEEATPPTGWTWLWSLVDTGATHLFQFYSFGALGDIYFCCLKKLPEKTTSSRLLRHGIQGLTHGVAGFLGSLRGFVWLDVLSSAFLEAVTAYCI